MSKRPRSSAELAIRGVLRHPVALWFMRDFGFTPSRNLSALARREKDFHMVPLPDQASNDLRWFEITHNLDARCDRWRGAEAA